MFFFIPRRIYSLDAKEVFLIKKKIYDVDNDNNNNNIQNENELREKKNVNK